VEGAVFSQHPKRRSFDSGHFVACAQDDVPFPFSLLAFSPSRLLAFSLSSFPTFSLSSFLAF
jgi:hypothetical protein